MGLCFSCIYSPNLSNADSSTPFYSFDDYTTYAKVVYVYDGDTVHIVLPLPNDSSRKLVKIKCRLYGIDTPELRNNDQKTKAKEARERLKQLLSETHSLIRVKCGKFDKYGRVLVTIYSEKYEKSLNQMLIDDGYAYPYYGKTKQK